MYFSILHLQATDILCSKQLAQSSHEFIIQNGYPERYLDLIDAKATSDDEVDPDGLQEKK
jgi:hypothetical protein